MGDGWNGVGVELVVGVWVPVIVLDTGGWGA